jgi:hypothetical protein
VVDVFFTADLRADQQTNGCSAVAGPGGGDTAHATASPLPLTKVFYLLIDADIFRGRSRSTIYSHAE